MPITASANEKAFTPCPAGVHTAVCVDVVDLGLLEVKFGSQPPKKQHKVQIVWFVDAEDPETGKPFSVQQRYTLSLNEKANMRRDLQSWRGKPFTEDELKGFDVEKLIGANCQLNVIHATRDGKTYANVQAIMPLGRGMAKMMVPDDYIRRKDREDQQGEDTMGSADYEPEEDVPF